MDYILALLSGAIGGSIISGLFTNYTSKKERKINFLKEQLNLVYAPIYLNLQFLRAFKSDHILKHKPYSQLDVNEKIESLDILSKINTVYIQTHANCIKTIHHILSTHYHLIDLDDIKEVNNYLTNYFISRNQLEDIGLNSSDIDKVYEKELFTVFYPNEQFMKQIDNKYKHLKEELKLT
ncbi:TPA: hypothetical protein KKW30_002471 [Legionella pneumophila]|nr:hypothetical protein [Legionella pneumophila]HAT5918125.1 hypothetical protein [Legionella pneumophila]HAT5921389.1 hypothetical protein [Legionella pneumophila]HAT5933837.1 hypothetical protein [Legionella pneumophila]HAT5948741.1 hypothetical protein [Legionella pneumophila]